MSQKRIRNVRKDTDQLLNSVHSEPSGSGRTCRRTKLWTLCGLARPALAHFHFHFHYLVLVSGSYIILRVFASSVGDDGMNADTRMGSSGITHHIA